MYEIYFNQLCSVFAILVLSTSSVCSESELKQTFVTEDFRNVTIIYKMIGCYKDKSNRALPKLLKDLRRLKPNDIISTCAKLAWNQGYQGFGVQFYGECWSSSDVIRHYDKYKMSSGCDRGIGGHWSNSIYFFTKTTPLLIAGPGPSRRITSGTFINLTCEIKSPFAVKITWYKNDDGEDSVHSGDQFNVGVVSVDQGYYWCKATTPYGASVQSDKTLVVLKDYFTSIVKFQLKGKTRSPRSEKYCMPCDQIVEYLTDQTSMKYTRGTCRTWSVRNQVEVECTIYRRKNNQNIADYYSNVRTSLRQAARRGELTQIQWRSLQLTDTEFCVQETTGKEGFKGVFTWPLRMPGQSSSVVCPYGPRDGIANRSCSGDFIRGVAWSIPDVQHCQFNSKKSEYLNKLSKIYVNTHNVKDVAKNLTKLIKSYQVETLTESDAELVAKVVQNIVVNKDKLHETADSVLAVVDAIMNINKTTLAGSETIAYKFTNTLDILAENIPIGKGKTSRVFNTSNLVLQVNDIAKTDFQGITFGVTGDGSPASESDSEHTEISIKLPPSLLTNTKKGRVRVGFIYYANNKLFQPVKDEDDELQQQNRSETSQQVLSSSVYNTNTSSLSEPVVLRFPKPEQEQNKFTLNSSCVFWVEDVSKWSDVGCHVCTKNEDKNYGTVECCCNHLTSFAVLFSPGPPKPSTEAYTKHAFALSIITYVGCGISLVGVLLTFLTYLLFRHLRKTNQQPILMNLCIAIALLLIVFVAGINSTNNTLGCQIVAVLLHYLTLVTVLWMGIEAYNLYLQIVKVMAIYQRRFMLKAAIVGWGVPILIVVATVIVATVEYGRDKAMNKTFKYQSDYACVLSDSLYRIIAWFAPILAILVFNLVIFILVIYKLNSTGAMIQVNSKSQQRRRCWTALAIMCLLGVTWLFGALAISDARIVFEYLFCIFNSLQGFFIFFFHCVRIKEVRSQWSLFVSGLGFSHRESESSHQRSKGFGESQHSSEAIVRVHDWSDKESDSQLQRKGTVLTRLSSKDGIFDHDNGHTGNNNY